LLNQPADNLEDSLNLFFAALKSLLQIFNPPIKFGIRGDQTP